MRAIANGWSHAISLYRHAALFINPPNSHMKALLTAKTCLLMSALLVTYCHRAHAQVRPTRHGLWMDVGLGHGSLHVSSDTLRSRSQDGIDFIWDFGWTFSSRLRAGIGVDQWTSKWGAGKQNWVTSFNILAYYYPLARRTFYLQAGAASADYMVVHVPTGGERADSTYFSGTAWGITTAVGWDIPVHGSLSLRPLLSYSYGPPRGLHSPDGTVIATGWKHDLLSLDVALVFHPRDSS